MGLKGTYLDDDLFIILVNFNISMLELIARRQLYEQLFKE
jgi:hypothetical protein